MKKEPNFILSPTLGNLYVFSNNLSVYFRFLPCYNGKDERQKYGVIEDSNKKAKRCYSPGNMLYMYSSFNNNPEIFVRKEIYAPELFIVRGAYSSLVAEHVNTKTNFICPKFDSDLKSYLGDLII